MSDCFTISQETLQCRSRVASTGTSGPTISRTFRSSVPSGSRSTVAVAAPCSARKAPSTGIAARIPAVIRSHTSSKADWSIGPEAPAPAAKVKTGSQARPASIARMKPESPAGARGAGFARSAASASPSSQQLAWNSAFVATGAWPLLSSMKPPSAIRGALAMQWSSPRA